MKKFFSVLSLTLFLHFFSPAAFGQDSAMIADPSLSGQYKELVRKSRPWQGSRLVNSVRLSNFWQNVQDSLRAEKKKNAPLQAKVAEQSKTIEDLKSETTAAKQDLQKTETAVNQVSFLGMAVDKGTYNTIMWGTIIVLALALAIILFSAGRNIREAKYRRQLYDEIAAEYHAFKVKANEKEIKLARELQTERNRVEELEKNR